METQAHGTDEVAALKANIARIEAEMAAMRALLERIRSQLGVPPQ
jgi:hypothetical protein